MNYLKKLLSALLKIIILIIIPYIITIISTYIYKILTNKDISIYINNYLIYILLLYYVLAIIYLIKKNKIKITRIKTINYYNYISIGISLSCILNMIIFLITKETIKLNYNLLFIISSTLIGPIYEEIIFRFIFYNRLKEFNSIRKSILMTTIIFSIIHISPSKIFFAFILGIIINIKYEKTNNLLVPILIHISANTIALFLNTYRVEILVLSILLLIINNQVDKLSNS